LGFQLRCFNTGYAWIDPISGAASMKVVILTQYFPPDPPGWIPHDIATALSSRGHDVKVLTSFPHYTAGRIEEGYQQKFNHVENHGQIQVRRVPIIPSHSSNPIGRIANYLSFAFSARLAKGFVRDADVIYVNGAPAIAADPARVWAKTLGIPYVYHVQDIWPESVTGSGLLPNPVLKITEKIINSWLGKVYSSAAAVNTIAPTAQKLLIERGVPREKSHLVFNWSNDAAGIVRTSRGRSSSGGRLTLVYAGNLGKLQDLETVIRAANRLGDLEGFRLLIAGSGVIEQSLKQLVNDLEANHYIEFLGRLDQDQVAALYASVDFQVVPLKNLDIFAGTIPSKFQSGLAHGLPLITTVKGDVTRLVKEHGLGFSALPENIDALAAAFREAYETSEEERQKLSQQARAFYETHLSRENAIDRIEAILRTAAESSITAGKP
jgi:glycosyltransferase involved in cell wall biosynthesis